MGRRPEPSGSTPKIIPLNAEVDIPTGSEENGQGKGVFVFEPSVSFGQLLPGDAFVHLQAGIELPSDRDRVDQEIFWAAVFGRTFTANSWGRSFSPMVEIIGRTEDGSTEWAIVPQVQLSLNVRQHVLANVGTTCLGMAESRDPRKPSAHQRFVRSTVSRPRLADQFAVSHQVTSSRPELNV